jgi:hypothetical protein
MPVFKYIESEKSKNEMDQIKAQIKSWVEFIQSHTNINKNTMFET